MFSLTQRPSLVGQQPLTSENAGWRDHRGEIAMRSGSFVWKKHRERESSSPYEYIKYTFSPMTLPNSVLDLSMATMRLYPCTVGAAIAIAAWVPKR